MKSLLFVVLLSFVSYAQASTWQGTVKRIDVTLGAPIVLRSFG